jgi:sugar phosphate isomerase/epimerase
MKIGLQLYTVRDAYKTKEEFKQILRQVKDMGYDGVEFAGYAGLEAEELRLFLKEIGLVPISSHHMITDLDQKLNEILEYNSKLGCKYIVCAMSPATNLKEIEELKSIMEKAQKAAKAYGIEVAYHNHSHEFAKLEDESLPMDRIASFCKLEVDTYWVFNVGIEPCHYLKDMADKISLVHLKDGDFTGHPCAVGEGFNNVKGIVETSKEIGMEWIIVENDFPTPDGLSDIRRSINYLDK